MKYLLNTPYQGSQSAFRDAIRQANALNNSAAGVAESQAPVTSEPGDCGVAPTLSAPSRAPIWRVTLHRNGQQWHSWHKSQEEAAQAAINQRSRGLGRVTIKKL